jgi:signal transduction histidine kinase
LRGGLWLGFRDGGLGYFQGGQLREVYKVGDGLGAGHIRGLQLGRDGTLWAATEGGLSQAIDGRIVTLNSKNGLPCDAIHWVMEDDEHSFWLYMACGLVRIAGPELDAWVATADKDPQRRIHATLFDSSDGVRYHATTTGYSPSVAESVDGRIWFLPWDGVGVIDPRRLGFNQLAPPVRVERVVADHRTYDASSKWPSLLPPLIRDLEIDYTALSFVAPEKVLFRYKLDGRDRDWQDAGTRRQAFYGNLPPRNYRFRVRACNNSGVWNEAGASFDFSITPAYYQTTWFQLSCPAVFLTLFWSLYELRRRQLQRQFNVGLEVRVNERTRIARELHDTLLQSFQGLLLKFQVASDLLAEGPAKQVLKSAINDASEAITEGRDAVQDLRSSTVTNDLDRAISALGQELAANQTGNGSALFRVEVEGTPRNLHAFLRDEVYRIAAEALRNAFRHAEARHIESEIMYEERQLRLRVRDDGKGLDPAVLRGEVRPGHFGLHGMRERAALIGARLDVWSKVDSGTEIELTIPASRAYATSRAAGAPRKSESDGGPR